jgi:hypothetical protein
MKKTALLLLCFIAATNLFAQKVFEGKLTYSFKIVGEGVEAYESMMPTSMEIYSGKKGMMVKMNGGMLAAMMGEIVSTPKEAYMLKHDEKTAYLMKDDEDSKNSPQVVKEDEVAEIQGFKCQKYKVTKTTAKGEQTAYIWVNSDYKFPVTGGKGGAENMAVPGVPGIAMKTMTSEAGMTVVLTATEFTTGKQDKKYFTIPKGYAKKDFDPSTFGL